ncbi:hypothetical protein GCM10022223_53450 [Kineosporia mesophila]|uniref:Mutator family transposase n=1 Tax=Kineosporia mesophila TaxID=566012 RepID=A0ABP7AC12_9ACTN
MSGSTRPGTGPGPSSPALVSKGTRRLGGLDDMIISLYAGGMTVRDIEDKRARAREKDRGKPAGIRTTLGHLVEGASVVGWTAAINTLDTAYPNRITPNH